MVLHDFTIQLNSRKLMLLHFIHSVLIFLLESIFFQTTNKHTTEKLAKYQRDNNDARVDEYDVYE